MNRFLILFVLLIAIPPILFILVLILRILLIIVLFLILFILPILFRVRSDQTPGPIMRRFVAINFRWFVTFERPTKFDPPASMISFVTTIRFAHNLILLENLFGDVALGSQAIREMKQDMVR